MGKVFAIAGGKGGVGKTTTAVNLATAFAAAGYDTVVVDADLGMANVAEALRVDHEPSVHEVLAGEANVEDAVATTDRGFDIVPGTQSLDAFAAADPANFRAVVGPLRERYDVVLLDTSAGLSHEVTVPLGLADRTILVTTPDIVAIKDAAKTGQLAKRVDGRVAGVLVTQGRDDAYTEQVVAELANDLLAVVPADERLVTDDTVALPGSPVARAYNELAAVLLGTNDLPEPAGTYAHVAPNPPTLPDDLTPATILVGADETVGRIDEADASDGTVDDDANDDSSDGDASDHDADDGNSDESDSDDAEPEETPASIIESAATEAGVDVPTATETTEDADDDATAEVSEERQSALGRLRGLFD